MNNEEMQQNKIGQCAYCMGIWSEALFQIWKNTPDTMEFKELKDKFEIFLDRMGSDIRNIFYGER